MSTYDHTTLSPGSKLWVCSHPTNRPHLRLSNQVYTQLLNLGYLDIDTTAILTGSNLQPPGSNPQVHDRRQLVMLAGLIHHPDIGLILFDTGSCEDVIANWKAHVNECTPRDWDKSVHGLPEAIAATGAGRIQDVKAVVLSHLHGDHAGGLEYFIDTSELDNCTTLHQLRARKKKKRWTYAQHDHQASKSGATKKNSNTLFGPAQRE